MPICSSRWSNGAKLLALLGTALLTVIAYQRLTGVYDEDFYYGDSAGHFVTGVMIADYASTDFGSNPVAFAEEYYVRCPKVGFGRWPPLFHFLQAGWYLVFGASKHTALVLIGAITAATLAVLFYRLHRLYGPAIAAAAVLLFASFPAIRSHTRIVMSDMLTLMFCMLAAFALADFLASRRTRDLLAIILWSFMAMLTKENGLHLALLVPCALGFAAGKSIWRNRLQCLIVIVVSAVGIGLAAFRLQIGSNVHGYQNLTQLVTRIGRIDDSAAVVAAFFDVASPVIFIIAAAGLLTCRIGRDNDERIRHVGVSVAWLLSIVAFFLLAPAPPEVRYFMPALVPLTILGAQSFHAMKTHLASSSRCAGIAAPWAMCVVAAFSTPYNVPLSIGGYSAVAQSIPVRPNLVTIISSDSFGEGAFIVERLMTDRSRASITLRADKALASSDWDGSAYQLLTKNTDEVYRYLLETPVQYVVLDTHRALDDQPLPHCQLLRRALEEHPHDFIPVGHFPRYCGGIRHDNAIVVYENVAARNRSPQMIRVALDHTLGRAIELDLNASPK